MGLKTQDIKTQNKKPPNLDKETGEINRKQG